MNLACFNSDSFHHDSLLNLKHVVTSRDNPYPVNQKYSLLIYRNKEIKHFHVNVHHKKIVSTLMNAEFIHDKNY